MYLGRDVMNRAVIEDLSEMPHLLIAGQTGSGKSACLNAILCSVLLARDPEEVKLILIDPKQVEFSKYEGIPHLMCPIVTVARKVPIVLDWVIAEMEVRYQWLAMTGVRKIADFNALGKREIKERYGDDYDPEKMPLRLPYLVVVVDEMNDLMIQAKKDMEDRITRIAQKSRAVGIHLILATQRPSVNVITGTIKANLPTRIAFQTAQGNDSRVILDQIGAEDLLGKGDFLYKPPALTSSCAPRGLGWETRRSSGSCATRRRSPSRTTTSVWCRSGRPTTTAKGRRLRPNEATLRRRVQGPALRAGRRRNFGIEPRRRGATSSALSRSVTTARRASSTPCLRWESSRSSRARRCEES